MKKALNADRRGGAVRQQIGEYVQAQALAAGIPVTQEGLRSVVQTIRDNHESNVDPTVTFVRKVSLTRSVWRIERDAGTYHVLYSRSWMRIIGLALEDGPDLVVADEADRRHE